MNVRVPDQEHTATDSYSYSEMPALLIVRPLEAADFAAGSIFVSRLVAADSTSCHSEISPVDRGKYKGMSEGGTGKALLVLENDRQARVKIGVGGPPSCPKYGVHTGAHPESTGFLSL